MSRDWPLCVRNNIHEKQERRYSEKECVLSNSRVTIVVENSREDYYVSEKIFQALRAGAVPVYLGAPNIKQLLPDPHAAILVDDFPTIDAAMKYAAQVNTNETLWLKHTAWKNKPFSQGFDALLRRVFSLCSVCEHFAPDARETFGNSRETFVNARETFVNVSQRLPACMLSRFSSMKNGLKVHITAMHAVGGIDAVFILGANQEKQAILGGTVRILSEIFDTEPLVISDFAPDKLSGDDRACFGGLSACKVLDPESRCASGVSGSGDGLTCVLHLFAAYIAVLHGFQNVAVFRQDVSINVAETKSSWHDLIRGIPAEYDVISLGACNGDPQKKRSAVVPMQHTDRPMQHTDRLACSGGYLLSQSGARRILLGKAVVKHANVSDSGRMVSCL
jgi:hypothetical protein